VDGSLNVGNQVTDDIKSMVKVGSHTPVVAPFPGPLSLPA